MFWTDLINHLCKYNINHLIQVHIPSTKNNKSFITKMKCQVTSSKTHDVLISKEIIYKSYKEICGGEPKKVNLGYNYDDTMLKVENNTLIFDPPLGTYLYGERSYLSYNWEVLSKFFSHYNIEPKWLDCGFSWGWYDEEQGGWTGCVGKV